MKKDIYVIKNRINNLVYVGQAINSAERFIAHCKPSSIVSGNSIIDKAIQKYGANNFWFEIIEQQVENYNEREKYWIKELNTIYPNGYNIQQGGEEPPVYYGIEHPLSTFSNIEEIRSLKNDLKNSQMSLSEIAKKYQTSKRTVMRINQGLHYEDVNETYPIRKVPLINGKLTNGQVKEIIEILKFTYRQYEDIGKQYGVSSSTIRKINSGEIHKQTDISYPIRKYKNSGSPNCTYAQVTEIIDLLTTTNISYNQISKCYNIDLQTIYLIKNGTAKRYRRDGYSYPLRKNNPIK
mgnify:FL=1|jgi:group I intron endonuclease